MISLNDKNNILSHFPSIKLSYENIIHKKVDNADVILAIPCGKKNFIWFTTLNNKHVCIAMELTKNKNNIEKLSIVNIQFPSYLANGKGTILYGTLFHNSQNIFYSIEDIFCYKGENKKTFNWENKFQLLTNILKTDLTKYSSIIFGLPLLSNNINDLINKIKNVKYKIYTIQFRSFKNVNNYLYSYYKYEQTSKDIKSQNILKTEVIFLVKPDIQTDIYNLYCLKNEKEEYYGVAYIPSYTISVMMNKLFRNIKENINLDTLEESDDEEEFENNNENRFVYLDKSYKMTCSYNYKFKKWCPNRLANLNADIVTYEVLNSSEIKIK